MLHFSELFQHSNNCSAPLSKVISKAADKKVKAAVVKEIHHLYASMFFKLVPYNIALFFDFSSQIIEKALENPFNTCYIKWCLKQNMLE